MDQHLLLGIYFSAICLIVAILFYLRHSSKKTDNDEQQEINLARRNVLDRMRQSAVVDEDFEGHDEKKLSKSAKKHLQKEQKKQDKADLRAMEEAARETKQQKSERYLERQRKKEELREQEEKDKLEEVKRLKELHRKEEEDIYTQWKDVIEIEDSGDTTINDQNTELQTFVEYFQKHKVANLEDIASDFNMRTQIVADRIKTLVEDGSLSGFLEDKGRFISVTPDEMEKVAQFIEKKGRISVRDLVSESNKLIDLNQV